MPIIAILSSSSNEGQHVNTNIYTSTDGSLGSVIFDRAATEAEGLGTTTGSSSSSSNYKYVQRHLYLSSWILA